VPSRSKSSPSARKSAVATKPDPQTLALSVPEAAYECRVSVNTIWNLIRDGDLASFTVNRRRLVARRELEAFMAGGGTEGVK
jgi:excisionase family DNA binding protein